MSMIAHIRGTLVEKNPACAVIEACGIGYELLIPVSTYDRLPRVGEEVKLLAAHVVREDDELLFGFASAEEREMFSKLTSVSGVGPKIALAILSGSSISELSLAIASADYKRISAIKGVGKKTAEKICVDLKDKVNPFAGRETDASAASPVLKDAVAALRGLGFNEENSIKMVTDVLAREPKLNDVKQLIKLALSSRN